MKQQNATVMFFLTRSLFFGLGISLLCNYTNKDTYIGALIGTILGLFIVLGYKYIIQKKQDKSLLELFSKNKFIGLLTRIILLCASVIILIYTLLSYKTFVSSFLLATTPVYMILIPWILLLIYCAWCGLDMINKISYSLFPFSIILALFSIISIFGNFDFDNFLPILTVTPKSMFISIISFAGISSFPGILSLHLNSDIKNYIKFYLLAVFLVIIAIMCINGVFGSVLVNVFRFPEYMVLKQVKLFDFIEKIENILSIAWSFDLFITSSFCIYSIKSLIPQKNNNFYSLIIICIIAFVINSFLDFNYVYELFLYYALTYISIIVPIIIIILLLIIIKKKT